MIDAKRRLLDLARMRFAETMPPLFVVDFVSARDGQPDSDIAPQRFFVADDELVCIGRSKNPSSTESGK